MTDEQKTILRELASRYIWWKSSDPCSTQQEEQPERIAAQVMNLGDYGDVERLDTALGEDFLRSVVSGAEVGQFNPRSWHYWNYRLGLAELGSMPEPPKRRLP